jgi:hypothetical protein
MFQLFHLWFLAVELIPGKSQSWKEERREERGERREVKREHGEKHLLFLYIFSLSTCP